MLHICINKQAKTNKMKTLKNRLLTEDAFVDFQDTNDNQISVWFNKRTNNFCLELNSKIIKAAKTWKTIQSKLNSFGDLEELM